MELGIYSRTRRIINHNIRFFALSEAVQIQFLNCLQTIWITAPLSSWSLAEPDHGKGLQEQIPSNYTWNSAKNTGINQHPTCSFFKKNWILGKDQTKKHEASGQLRRGVSQGHKVIFALGANMAKNSEESARTEGETELRQLSTTTASQKGSFESIMGWRVFSKTDNL